MTLAQLRGRLEQRIGEAEAMRATAPVADVLRLVLAELEGLAADVAPGQGEEDRLLTAAELARHLGVSPRYIYDHANSYPFTCRLGPHTVRFSAHGLERWLARRQ